MSNTPIQEYGRLVDRLSEIADEFENMANEQESFKSLFVERRREGARRMDRLAPYPIIRDKRIR